MRREARIVTQLMIKREKESAINNMGTFLRRIFIFRLKGTVTCRLKNAD